MEQNKELEALDIIKRNNFLEQENKELREKYIAYKEELETLRMLYNASSQKLPKLEQENKNLKNSLEISLSESQKLRKENYNYQKVIELIKDLIDIDFEDGSDTDLIIGMRHYVRIPKEIENDIKEVFGNENC